MFSLSKGGARRLSGCDKAPWDKCLLVSLFGRGQSCVGFPNHRPMRFSKLASKIKVMPSRCPLHIIINGTESNFPASSAWMVHESHTAFLQQAHSPRMAGSWLLIGMLPQNSLLMCDLRCSVIGLPVGVCSGQLGRLFRRCQCATKQAARCLNDK